MESTYAARRAAQDARELLDGGSCLAGPRCIDLRPAAAGLLDGTTPVRPATPRPRLTLAPIAAAYSDADFRNLLKTGVGAGGRDVGFMGVIVRENLHALSDAEIAQIHAYLKVEAARK